MRVLVYRNLNNGLITIKAKIMHHKGSVVIGHAESVHLQDAGFIVHESGRQRVIREKRKNVHAFVKGLLVAVNGFRPYKGRAESLPINYPPRNHLDGTVVCPITYNPYKFRKFVHKDTQMPVDYMPYAWVRKDGAIYGSA